MKIIRLLPLIWIIYLTATCGSGSDTEDLQRAFVELRFGAFFHYGIRTYTGQPCAMPGQDVSNSIQRSLTAASGLMR